MSDRSAQGAGNNESDADDRVAAVRLRLDGVTSADPVPVAPASLHFSEEFSHRVRSASRDWRTEERVRRLWQGDADLWSGGDEARWLGWLEAPLDGLGPEDLSRLRELEVWADEILSQPPEHSPVEEPETADELGRPGPCVVLLGMGGSSLGPEVLGNCLARRHRLLVVDTTDPAQVDRAASLADLSRSVFVVSSKSGSTLETNLLCDHFLDRVGEVVGSGKAAERFVAITDAGSSLEAKAQRLGFHAILHGTPCVGGRYSVLSVFGLGPAALVGIDAERLLHATLPMIADCLEPGGDNPGLQLGLALGLAAQDGRDKLTLIADDELQSFGGWVEQLVAESTGKRGFGVIPVDLEELADPATYSDDRFFVRLVGDGDRHTEESPSVERFQALSNAGHPTLTIQLTSDLQIAQEFFRWEFATAVCGAVLGIDPFDQPDVEAAKESARRLAGSEETGVDETLVAEGGSLQVWVPTSQRRDVLRPQDPDVVSALQAHLQRVEINDYFSILAYVERSEETLELLQSTRHKVRDRLHVATSLGFGPRYLHSTGQLHKGGPNSGVFLLITQEDPVDIDVLAHGSSFGATKAAQAAGDYSVLADRERRVLRVHLTGRLSAGLQRLDGQFGRALQQLELSTDPAETESESA